MKRLLILSFLCGVPLLAADDPAPKPLVTLSNEKIDDHLDYLYRCLARVRANLKVNPNSTYSKKAYADLLKIIAEGEALKR